MSAMGGCGHGGEPQSPPYSHLIFPPLVSDPPAQHGQQGLDGLRPEEGVSPRGGQGRCRAPSRSRKTPREGNLRPHARRSEVQTACP